MNGEGGNEGIGFAIPIDMARSVMEQLIQHGKVERGHIGVTITPLSADMAQYFGYTGGGNGALIDHVNPGSPAAKAGLKHGDIVLALNGESITGSGQLSARIANEAPGTTIHLKVFRDGKTFDVPVTLAPGSAYENQPGQQNPSSNSENQMNGEHGLEGVHVVELTPDIADQLQLPTSTHGVVVDNVDQGSAAQDDGLQRGDVIVEVNRKPVGNVDQFRSALENAGNKPVLLLVIPRGQPTQTQYILIKPNS